MKQKQSFGEWLANKLADSLATMAMFFVITALTVSILFFQTPHSPLEWVQYVIQTFFQGVALPVLAFVAKIAGERQEKLLQETHDAVMNEMKEIKELLAKMNNIEQEEKQIENEIHSNPEADFTKL